MADSHLYSAPAGQRPRLEQLLRRRPVLEGEPGVLDASCSIAISARLVRAFRETSART
jgi:hypothetical protein